MHSTMTQGIDGIQAAEYRRKAAMPVLNNRRQA